MICEICGNSYVKSCQHCYRRVMAWGELGTQKLIDLSRRDDNISIEELLDVSQYYRGKSRGRSIVVSTARRAIRDLGYRGVFVGQLPRNTKKLFTYAGQVSRNNSLARRWRLRKDECELCHSTDELELHHRVPQSWGGKTTPENSVTLCKSCHLKVHQKLKQKLNRLQLLEYLEPHRDEIARLAQECIS